ncbi:MAG: hypothetical protein JO189_09325 [Deltaproteobacteria bacterium]|nr:hypothetical protein [Deltaproteobacteria bacterium]
MAITVKKTVLWRKELNNQPGTLAEALEPLAQSETDLKLVMLYRFPGTGQGAVEVHPISGRKAIGIARSTGLAPSSIPVLLVEGDNRVGLGYAVAKAVADSGVNVSFLMAQVVGRRYAAVFGFENDTDATKAATLIKRVAATARRS